MKHLNLAGTQKWAVFARLVLLLMLVACGAKPTQMPTETPLPPAATSIPPTATAVPPTATPESWMSKGCGSEPPATPGETEVLSMRVAGLEREYRLHLPDDYDENVATSLVLAFHWYKGNARNMESLTWLSHHADRHGYIAVYPQATWFEDPIWGTITSWNDLTCNASPGPEGPTCTTAMRWSSPPECGETSECTWCSCYDDVAFVDQLLDELEDTLCIDPDRVYATGISNGAMLAHRLGCDRSDRFAAIAPVAGTLAKGFNCAPGGSVSTSIMYLHGDRDGFVPADGSEGSDGHFFVAVDDMIDAWASATSQDCDDFETTYRTSMDGTRDLVCTQRAHCVTGAEVVSCSWKGNHSSSLGMSVPFGNDVIWEFFDKNARQR